MRKFRLTALVAAALTAAALAAGSALAATTAGAKVIVFSATYKGTATVKVADNVADISASGPGLGTVIGAGKVSGAGKGDTASAESTGCVPWFGTGTITGKNGTLAFKVAGAQACGGGQGEVFSITGRATVTKATGKLAKAKGTLKLSGSYDDGAKTFSVKFSGKLLQP